MKDTVTKNDFVYLYIIQHGERSVVDGSSVLETRVGYAIDLYDRTRELCRQEYCRVEAAAYNEVTKHEGI